MVKATSGGLPFLIPVQQPALYVERHALGARGNAEIPRPGCHPHRMLPFPSQRPLPLLRLPEHFCRDIRFRSKPRLLLLPPGPRYPQQQRQQKPSDPEQPHQGALPFQETLHEHPCTASRMPELEERQLDASPGCSQASMEEYARMEEMVARG
jgi:hypothetical protein